MIPAYTILLIRMDDIMRTVLIVDDSALMRTLMRTIVTKNGYEVVGEADNGSLGVEKYKELLPDIVTMDVTMKGMDGIEALRQIMNVNVGANVLMVSSMGQGTIVRQAIEYGAKDFILKPYEEKQVLNALHSLS